MENIYNRVVNDYIRPYAIDRFQLDGKDWDYLIDESFIIKYPHDKQAHLSVRKGRECSFQYSGSAE